MLSLGVAAQGAGCVFMFGLPFLIPLLRDRLDLTLAQAGVIVGAPSAGMLLTLIAWGWLADRYGERLAMALGLGLATVFLVCAAFTTTPGPLAVLLALAGASGASANAASGRVVLGWFPAERRGVAMGWRQTAQPIGVAVAGAVLPSMGGLREALLLMAGICLVTGIAVVSMMVDPPRGPAKPGERTDSPYKGSTGLWRIHVASMLLVVPQFATATFALTYLVAERQWNPATAGQLVAVAQFAGAGGRLLCGRWSDWARSRLRPMRRLAVLNASVMVLLAVAVHMGSAVGTPLLIVALVISMSGNGLAFTAVSEMAGPAWAGRALGGQNTVQNIAAATTPAVLGALITHTGFGAAFGLAGALALVAAFATPSDAT
ncbi:MFS transporter [Sphaerisporangium flaviroseum]|uniref:MFS transporter n=2 Tax=Sphaerisporangium flaviroseum TaxID=509199 RepID=A0ABP7HAY2_9ACTN